jgi:hypothetical protein
MIPTHKQTQRAARFFSANGHFTACREGVLLSKLGVGRFKNLAFASGFFEGKSRNKRTNNNTSE